MSRKNRVELPFQEKARRCKKAPTPVLLAKLGENACAAHQVVRRFFIQSIWISTEAGAASTALANPLGMLSQGAFAIQPIGTRCGLTVSTVTASSSAIGLLQPTTSALIITAGFQLSWRCASFGGRCCYWSRKNAPAARPYFRLR